MVVGDGSRRQRRLTICDQGLCEKASFLFLVISDEGHWHLMGDGPQCPPWLRACYSPWLVLREQLQPQQPWHAAVEQVDERLFCKMQQKYNKTACKW